MASIRNETSIGVSADTAWAALRAPGDAARAFSPVLVESKFDGKLRTVRFANGLVICEQILDVDEAHRRVSYSAVEVAGMLFHHSSMEIFEDGPDRCRFVWITDFHPEGLAGTLAPFIEQGARALKANLEK